MVTGGAGFLGSHLCERLVKENQHVLCLDNFITGSKANIKHLLNEANFELLQHDLVHPIILQVDQIYNLACPASPIQYQSNPIKTIKTNLLGAINMLELARKANAAILQASTSEIYGDPTMHPQKEDYWGNTNPIGPRACYDEGKRCAETLFFDYYRQAKTRIKVVRIFNTYGPKMDLNDGRVISNFIVQALTNQDITIYGKGNHTRSFCYVDDLIEGLIRMMNSPDNFIGPVNLGNPDEISILEVARLILRLTQSKSNLIFCDLPQDDPGRRQPDIGLAKERLDWQPKLNLKKGLIQTIEYFKTLL